MNDEIYVVTYNPNLTDGYGSEIVAGASDDLETAKALGENCLKIQGIRPTAKITVFHRKSITPDEVLCEYILESTGEWRYRSFLHIYKYTRIHPTKEC